MKGVMSVFMDHIPSEVTDPHTHTHTHTHTLSVSFLCRQHQLFPEHTCIFHCSHTHTHTHWSCL